MAPRSKGNEARAVEGVENPKDAISVSKLPTCLVPDSMRVFASLAFLEGALKYGSYNWRVAGIRASVYRSALDRHITKWWNGEDTDPLTGVPHLASALACIAIILDADVSGRLTDDRPPAQLDISALVDTMQDNIKKLKELYGDIKPQHYTIENSGVKV